MAGGWKRNASMDKRGTYIYNFLPVVKWNLIGLERYNSIPVVRQNLIGLENWYILYLSIKWFTHERTGLL